ncbi:MAG: MurR/RpiR family transcriptional regulator [Solobacterium sp.]|nr:MurR/RpiR family transcriptional regulator [Solobacterium sp.]
MTISESLAIQENFSDSEREIADYILSQKEKILEQSVHDICDATFTSTSSVVRLCRKIGFSGYKEFKIRYARELERRIESLDAVDPDFPFGPKDTVLDISQKMNVLMINTLNSTYDILTRNSKSIKQAAELILHSNRISLIAMGDSYLKGQLFQSNMMKIGKVVLMANVFGENYSHIDLLEPSDCAIVISYSGDTKQVYDAAKVLKRRGVPLIVITANAESKCGKLSGILIDMPNKEEKWKKQATFFSQIATEYILNVIYSCIYVMDYEKSTNMRHRSIQEYSDTRY